MYADQTMLDVLKNVRTPEGDTLCDVYDILAVWTARPESEESVRFRFDSYTLLRDK